MAEIIPSINASTFGEVQELIKKVEPYVLWCHLDVTDGVFSKHLTWRNPRDLEKLNTKLNAEAHLMVFNPEKVIGQWLISPIKRVIIHIEAEPEMKFIISECQKADVQVGLAINPETPWTATGEWLGKVDLIQTLAVHPGPSGQPIDPKIFEKIAEIRQACPECLIEIDGGINSETAKKAREAGADILVAGYDIFHSPDIGAEIKELGR